MALIDERSDRAAMQQQATSSSQAAQIAMQQMGLMGVVSWDTLKALTDPLEIAIRDPEVDIYTVIELAEAKA